MKASKAILLCHRSLFSTYTIGRWICFWIFADSSSGLHCILSVSHESKRLYLSSTYGIIEIVLLLLPQPICGYKCHGNKMCCSSV